MNRIGDIIRHHGMEWIAQSINFDHGIMSDYYVGEHFLNADIKKELSAGVLSARVESAGKDGFMPKLVEELKWIIGDGNYRYDGYAFGENEINFYFLIRKAEYDQIMNKIKYWAIIKDFDDKMSYDLKKAQSFVASSRA